MNDEIKNVNGEENSEEMVGVGTQDETSKDGGVPRDSTEERSSSGPLVGIAIIVVVLIIGGIYFLSTATKEDGDQNLETAPGEDVEVIINKLNIQSSSDEVVDIETDLDLTDLDNLDSELDDLINAF